MQGLDRTIQFVYQFQSRLGQLVRHHPPVLFRPVPPHQPALFQPVHQPGNIRIARHQAAPMSLQDAPSFPAPRRIRSTLYCVPESM